VRFAGSDEKSGIEGEKLWSETLRKIVRAFQTHDRSRDLLNFA
jgi:hypothetical protein